MQWLSLRWNRYKTLAILSLLLLFGCQHFDVQQDSSLVIRFDRPASVWEESLPLGNGRIGMMPDGGVDKELIPLNEISLWSGSKQNTDNPQAQAFLPQIQTLLFEGRNMEAQQLMYSTFVCGGKGSGKGNGANTPYGSFQLFGNLHITYHHETTDSATNYLRTLDLNKALSSTTYSKDGVRFRREAYTAFGEDIGVFHLTADRAEALSFSLELERPEHSQTRVEGKDLLMVGRLPDGVDSTSCQGMRFAARIRVLLPKEGTLKTAENTLTVEQASEAVVLIALATDYFGKDPETKIQEQLDQAAQKTLRSIKGKHIDSFRSFFGRASLHLESSGREQLPMDERLKAYASDGNDPSLDALYFQYGRYLLISSTRVGLLPPNLQGLWCNTIQTPWNGDYHLNINLQMNHWLAEQTNLSELHLPLIEWTKKQVPSGRNTAKVFYNAQGWVTHILGNLWEFTAPGEHPSWGATNTSAAWLCQHLYHHYLYTMDKAYLEEVYPVMKEAALFFTDMLVRDPRNGYLVTAPTTSPENHFRTFDGTAAICAGSTMDNQIIRELFSNTIEASIVLGKDSTFANILKEKREELMPTTIGEDGRIMEWLEPFEEVEPTHRHVSHLYGLHPGDEISVEGTPLLAAAARKTLERRGNKSTGWSMAWKINFWARLHDGIQAHTLLKDLLTSGTYPNLFCKHPPFQIDGNFGGTAGIAEMLLQSQAGMVELLPALPPQWKSGRFAGLRVRGGGEVDLAWEDGEVKQVRLKAFHTNAFTIKLPRNAKNLRIEINKKAVSLPIYSNLLTVNLDKGDVLQLLF